LEKLKNLTKEDSDKDPSNKDLEDALDKDTDKVKAADDLVKNKSLDNGDENS